MALGGSFGLGIVLTASDLASSAIKGFAKNFANLDDQVTSSVSKIAKELGVAKSTIDASMAGFAAGMAVAAIGVTGLVASFKLADSAGKFEHQIAEIGATTSLTAEQVDAFKKKAMELGAAGELAPTKTADAFRELASSTLTGNEALKALGPTIDLLQASFGRLSPEQAGGLVAKTLQAFPELANDATHAVDLLARAFKAGLKPEEIDHAMRLAAKGSKFLGSSLEEMLTTVAGVKGAGFQVNRLSKEIVNAAEMTTGFNRATLEMRARLGDAGVTAASMGDLARQTWDEAKENIGNSLDTIREDLGAVFLEFLKPALLFVRDSVAKVAKAFRELSPEAKKTFAQIAVFGSLATVVVGLGIAVASLMPLLEGVAVAAVPIIAVTTAIAAASFVVYKAWETNFGGIRDTVENVFGKIKLGVMSLVELFTKGEISGALADDLLKAENSGVFDFVESVSEAAFSIRAAWREIVPVVKNTLVELRPVFNALEEMFRQDVKGLLDIAIIFGRSLEVVVGLFTGHFEHVVRGAYGAMNALIDLVNISIDRLSKVPGFGNLQLFKMSKYSDAEINTNSAIAGAFLNPKQDIKNPFASPAGPPQAAGPPSSSSPTGTAGGLPASAGGVRMPDSAPVASAGAPSVTKEDLHMAIEAASRRSDPFGGDRQPIVVQSRVSIGSRELTAWQAQENRDRESGAGRISPWKRD